MVEGIEARRGTFVVPGNRTKPNGHTIGLHVVVLPVSSKPVSRDAVTYLVGGPGGAATDEAAIRRQQLTLLNRQLDVIGSPDTTRCDGAVVVPPFQLTGRPSR